MELLDCATQVMSKDPTERVRAILLTDWDPLIINGYGPPDEYDRYIPDILCLLESRCTVEQLTQHLGRIESEEMGLEPSAEATHRAAKSVLASWGASVLSLKY